MNELSVREAAAYLGVHPSRVRALLNAGTLHGRRVGSQWLINIEDIDRRKALIRGGGRSRAMSTRIAWAAAALADGQRADWISASERTRLRTRLLHHGTAADLPSYQRWLSTRQQGVTRYRLAAPDLPDLLSVTGVVATGLSAARAFGCGLGPGGQADIYVTDTVARSLIKSFFLIASTKGNLTMRVVDGAWHQDTATVLNGQRVTPRLITALDLLDQRDARSTSTGRDLLTTTLHEFTAQRRVGAGRNA